MNERLKELARHSQMFFWPTDPEVVELSKDIDIEKFAELIVREFAHDCLDITGGNERILMVAKKWNVEL